MIINEECIRPSESPGKVRRAFQVTFDVKVGSASRNVIRQDQLLPPAAGFQLQRLKTIFTLSTS